MRVEAQTSNKILGIICVADVDARTVKGAQCIVEFVAPKASSGLDSDVPFLNKFGVAEFCAIESRIAGEFEIKKSPAGKRQEPSGSLRLDAEGDPLLSHPDHYSRFVQHEIGKSVTHEPGI